MLCQGEELRRYVEAGIGQALPCPATFIGKLGPDGEPLCVAAFCDWRDHSVELHVWSAGRFTRDWLRRLARYAFGELRVRYVRGVIAADRADWIAAVRRLGFVPEGVQRGGFDGEIDLAMFSIRQEEFRI